MTCLVCFVVFAEARCVAMGPRSKKGGAKPPPSLDNAFASLLLAEESPPSKPVRNKRISVDKQKGELLRGLGEAAKVDDADGDDAPCVLSEPLIWIDLEMTGLEPDKDKVLEIAVLVTDGSLERAIEGPDLVIHHEEAVLASMNAWSEEQHGKSGMTTRVRESKTSLTAAEDAVLAFVELHTPRHTPLAGSSVHMDLAFFRVHMPRLAAHLHYRIVDVSTVAQLAMRWFPKVMRKAPHKKREHTALADIRESLAELRWLRTHVFIAGSVH